MLWDERGDAVAFLSSQRAAEISFNLAKFDGLFVRFVVTAENLSLPTSQLINHVAVLCHNESVFHFFMESQNIFFIIKYACERGKKQNV